MSDFKCSLVNQENQKPLDVGRVFQLSCDGPWPSDFNKDNFSLELPESSSAYALKILNIDFKTQQNAILFVTSYTPGPVVIPHLVLNDKKSKLDLGEVRFSLQSVITAEQQQGGKVEPYGPMAPSNLPWPWEIILIVMGLFFVLGSYILFNWYRKYQKNKLLEKLSDHDSSMNPSQQFYHSLRKLQREHSFYTHPEVLVSPDESKKTLEQLNLMIRLYLSRKFKVPALDWNVFWIIQDLKKNNFEIWTNFKSLIKRNLTEIEKANAHFEKVTAKDLIQITRQIRLLVDDVDQFGIDSQKNKGDS